MKYRKDITIANKKSCFQIKREKVKKKLSQKSEQNKQDIVLVGNLGTCNIVITAFTKATTAAFSHFHKSIRPHYPYGDHFFLLD